MKSLFEVLFKLGVKSGVGLWHLCLLKLSRDSFRLVVLVFMFLTGPGLASCVDIIKVNRTSRNGKHLVLITLVSPCLAIEICHLGGARRVRFVTPTVKCCHVTHPPA